MYDDGCIACAPYASTHCRYMMPDASQGLSTPLSLYSLGMRLQSVLY